jgi:bifunctional DNA-binding transcriptional regulator/antitoxin component of YhaV-PrlF toxin-antitoxin module
MTPDYQKVWDSLNDLEMVSCKISSAREILDSAIDALESGNREKAETLMYAADEFLQYYLKEFDNLFKVAWKETVVKLKEEDPCMPPWGHSDLEYGLANPTLTQDRNSNFPGENTDQWTSFWEKNYHPEEYKGSTVSSVKPDKVKKWVLPVEETKIVETDETDYFVTFPDDLLEAANLKEGDQIEWVDQGDGSYLLKKVAKTYDEMIAAGWTMTADGFWIKDN